MLITTGFLDTNLHPSSLDCICNVATTFLPPPSSQIHIFLSDDTNQEKDRHTNACYIDVIAAKNDFQQFENNRSICILEDARFQFQYTQSTYMGTFGGRSLPRRSHYKEFSIQECSRNIHPDPFKDPRPPSEFSKTNGHFEVTFAGSELQYTE